MIIKMLRCKQRSDIGRLVDYVLCDKERIKNINDTFFIAHNMYARNQEEFKKAFYANDEFRKKRKNGVVIYHEVLSFSEKDKVTLKQLEYITQKYIALRANDAIVLAKPHIEEGHYHVHLLISGTACCSSKVMRLDNKQFAHVRKSIEKYQLEKYPELTHSIVHINKKEKDRLQEKEGKNKRKERGLQTKKRMGTHKKLDKEKLQKALFEMLDYSQTKDDFMRFLEQESLELYLYRGKLTGVIYKGRKYRFRTLGIPKERLLALEQGRVLSDIKQKEPLLIVQESWLLKYKEQLDEIKKEVVTKKSKKLGILTQNILDRSRTYNQFLFFARQVGFYIYKKGGVEKGISLKNKEYSFMQLGVWEQIVRLRSFQQQRGQRKEGRESDLRRRDIGINSTLDFGLDFFI